MAEKSSDLVDSNTANQPETSSTTFVQELVDQLALAKRENLRLQAEVAWYHQTLHQYSQYCAYQNYEFINRLRSQEAITQDILEGAEGTRAKLEKQISVHLDEKAAAETSNAEIIEFIYEDSQAHFEHLRTNYELQLEDIYRKCAVNISHWKADYERHTQLLLSNANKTGDDSDTNDSNLTRIWEAFQGLSTSGKVLVVIGIIIVITVLGVVSWKFIVWAWPMLVQFSSVMSLPSWICSSYDFLSSDASVHLLKAWRHGTPLSLAFAKSFGVSLLPNILQMAPDLLSMMAGT